ncbi:MAG: DUF1517 domain-containing protein [Alkalinema sp. RU_4_3]|nr:DUF1517 domain-containing protein [Alkalinema sp. RU_4_3]
MKRNLLSLGLMAIALVTLTAPVEAKRSGGRSSGGSIERAPVSRPDSPNNPNSNPNNNPNRNNYGGGGPGYVPVPYGGGGGFYGGGGMAGGAIGRSLFDWIMLLGLMGLGTGGMLMYFSMQKPKAGSKLAEMNDLVTFSQIQVGFYATDCPIQKQLTDIVETLQNDDSRERLEQLQAVTLAILRQPKFWSHVKSSSETFKKRSEAQASFNSQSMVERRKYDQESLTRRAGHEKVVKLAPLTATEEDQPAAYVVVSLLVGSTHDQPLFEPIHSAESLRSALEKLSGMTQQELLQFEFIWTPQDPSESLGSEDLLVDFPDLQLV